MTCTAIKCYRYKKQNPCHNCLYNPKDIPTTKLIMRKQKFPCPNPDWPELEEVPIDYQGKEWPK